MPNSHRPPDKKTRSCLCRVWCAGVNWTIAVNVFRLQMFCRSATVLSCRESNFTPPKRTRHCRQDSFVVSGVAVCVSFNRPTFQHCSWLTSCRSPTVVVTTALGLTDGRLTGSLNSVQLGIGKLHCESKNQCVQKTMRLAVQFSDAQLGRVQTATPDLHKFFYVCYPWPYSSVLLWRRSAMVCTSGFMGDAILW